MQTNYRSAMICQKAAPRASLPLSRLIVIAFCFVACGLANAASAENPPGQIDFAHKVAPVLKKHCVKCHGGSESKGGFSLNTRELILDAEGALPGKSGESRMIELIRSNDKKSQMPPKTEPRLSKQEIQILTDWIDRGMRWEDGFSFASERYEPPLRPHSPKLPAISGGRTNPIDRIIDAYFQQNQVARPKPLNDATFLRRISLDLVGLPPTAEELAQFMADSDPQKRSKWIDRTLNRKQDYAEHWLTFWNDLLRNAYSGTGFIDGGRKPITGWLYRALLENRPYDQFVRELVAPTGESEGFIRGIKWRGNVNASQVREIQFAQSTAQVFLGINMKCASCHDSFIDRWTLQESYGLAAIYSQRPLEIHRCDKPTGKIAKAGWIFPTLGQVDPKAKQPERLKQLAGLMTHRQNGRFSRTIVNRIWSRMMGRGIVHPVDAMHTKPWNEDLLDYLASHLAENQYDLKRTMRLIATSAAYQSQTTALADDPNAGTYVYQGPLAKRMTAEQFLDSIRRMSNVWPAADGRAFKRDGRGQGGQLADVIGGKDAAKRWGDRPIRTVLTPLNALQASLGRPIREQIVTSRPTQLTTLEAINLTNGARMSQLLQQAAAKRLGQAKGGSGSSAVEAAEFVERLFVQSLSRTPTPAEQQTCVQMLGSPVTTQGVEDLMWTVYMLPEFQLIR